MRINYDKERVICNMVAGRSEVEIQVYHTAMKQYMAMSGKKLNVLLTYAEKMDLRDEIHEVRGGDDKIRTSKQLKDKVHSHSFKRVL